MINISKNSKRVLMGSLLILLFSGTAFAKESFSQQNRMSQMVKRLDLSEEQAEQFKAIMSERVDARTSKREQMDAVNKLIDAGQIDEAAKVAATNASDSVYKRAAFRQKIENILTVEQIEKMRALKSKSGNRKRMR